MKTRAVIVAALVLTLGLSACGKAQDRDKEALLGAISKTEKLARGFVYEEQTLQRKLLVQGLIEDDFRYKARVTVGGNPALDEVVNDDTLAVRLIDPSALNNFLPTKAQTPVKPKPPKDPKAAPGSAENPLTGPLVQQALLANRWIIDPAGAPNLTASTTAERKPGDDPVFDALTALSYLRTITQDGFIRKFNEDALDYKPQEDPFKDLKPDRDDGEVRYDFVRFDIPRLDDSATGATALPSERNFRFMAVFVNSQGYITKVFERIEVNEKILDKLRTFSRAFVKSKFPNQLKNFDAAVAKADKLPIQQQANFFIQGINAQRKTLGEDPIRMRVMKLELVDLGKANTVILPTEQVLEGDLSILINRGKAANQSAAATATTSTTATTISTGGESGGGGSENPFGEVEGGGGDTSGGTDPAAGIDPAAGTEPAGGETTTTTAATAG